MNSFALYTFFKKSLRFIHSSFLEQVTAR
uniref:Uncharacterized protein n=1 Tax=Anguilla anguilla TaxID=7936 RepID=A0A0E9PE61_ANGAN